MNHQMKLKPNPFSQITSGRKTVEIRLNDLKRRQIKVGDKITFSNTESPESSVTVIVTALTKEKDFTTLFEKVDPYLAGWDKDTTPEQASKDIRKYYDRKKESQYGTLAIFIKREGGDHL